MTTDTTTGACTGTGVGAARPLNLFLVTISLPDIPVDDPSPPEAADVIPLGYGLGFEALSPVEWGYGEDFGD